ncbi:flagellar biosynthesis protein [Nitrosomonas sp. JL21]|uniref:EscU/YscU/HrcU family type III secretion system export apparatus switch protein n=1 Tax=Nitrosomonas sp. JL21 TaxID=153949 RepID=UPI001368CE70|nr:EscU/YscU/HrcU family type III secretion system export apparatus switch protein [Nitrosomonas sp. JL21]MBL8497616.1 EscU/YscU/HrcU family type III secretion system export apparatus switch protein [Nitrosomonas sp.]MXS77787.1 flagellar biosynthesis protein [Nitrosomonas sp. JL21]
MTGSESLPTAVALAYREGQIAPKVVAKGRGLVAEEIIKRAKEAGIYVHESSELVSLLMQVNLDDRIPPQLYIAVAELLAWLYRLDQKEAKPLARENF